MFLLNRIKYLILILFCFFLIPSVYALVEPTSKFYINDYANILSEETENYILNKSIALNNADGTQIVVVTVPNLRDQSLEDYSLNLFRKFGIGDKEKNNGLLLLLALEERKFRVEVGYGLEGILPDGKTGRFQDQYIIPYLKENKWDEGIKNGYDAFYSEIVKLNNLNIDYNSPIDLTNSTEEISLFAMMLIITSPFIGVVAGIFIKLSKKKVPLTIIYLIAWALLFYIFKYYMSFINNLIFFLISRFASLSTHHGGYGGSFRGGGFSGGGFSGGGGSSGGAGSSRGF